MATPLRISEKLVEKAEKQVRISLRSVPKQIEFWANIGQEIESALTPADLMALANGEAEVKLIRKTSVPIDMDLLFSNIEKERSAGSLSAKVLKDEVWYEESKDFPGYLVRVSSRTGKREVGKFANGAFKVKSKRSR